MPSSEQGYELRQKAAKYSTKATGTEATALSLGDILMEGVRDDRAKRGVSKLAEDKGRTMEGLVTDPNRIREHGTSEGRVMDPLMVDKFTSDARADNLKMLGTESVAMQEKEGSLDEVIQAGANRLYGEAAMMEAQAKKYAAEADAMFEKLQEQRTAEKHQYDIELLKKKISGGTGGGAEETGFMEDFNADLEELANAGISGDALVGALVNLYPELGEAAIRQMVEEGGTISEETVSDKYGTPTPGSRIRSGVEAYKNIPTVRGVAQEQTKPSNLLRNVLSLFMRGGKQYTQEEVEAMTPEERKKLGL